MKSFVLVLVLLLVGPAPIGTTVQPQTSFNITEAQEIEIGRRAAIDIEMDFPLVGDSGVERYVSSLGQRLARESGRSHIRYRFKIINNDEINAFALPGGFIYVSRGLIEAAENESELAGVLSHEIGHVVARHSVSQIRRAKITDLGVSALGPIFGGGVKAILAKTAGKVVATGITMNYSREDEREADRLGAKNLYDAGYDPRGMITFFERLAARQEREPGLVEGFFASHPSPAERIDNISDLIASFPKKDLTLDSQDFRQVKDRLAVVYPPDARPTRPRPQDSAVPTQTPAVAEDFEDEEDRHREIAAVFAPILYQGLGDQPRYDYITNFDFDGDWRGDNNWKNASDTRYALKAWVYYSVRETQTHFFVHYAAFHPRDYKGAKRRGSLLSRVIRRGVSRVRTVDPTGRADELVLAHENDLEGCLVVAEKNGDDLRKARVVFVETLAHNKFYKYVVDQSQHSGFEEIGVEGRRARLFVEPKGHGIEAYRGDEKQLESAANGVLIYTFTGVAEDPVKRPKGPIGYDLAPLATTLWPPARRGLTLTYAETHDYGVLFLETAHPDGAVSEREISIGQIGSAFRGKVGGANMARPPWAWFDGGEKELLGEWFFDPARAIKRHFNLGDEFSTVYLERSLSQIFAERPAD
ncbi:MAG TPA: M48 family metallopeptidase [Pyrinomonadaceae bacterium]|nr:M48 family metallopeptidase [Pyrinomonadaceae bacterium]